MFATVIACFYRVVEMRFTINDDLSDTDSSDGSWRPGDEPGATATQKHPSYLRVATYNIVDGRKNRLLQATRAIRQHNIDVAVLTEAKLSTELYPKQDEHYDIQASKSKFNQGGIALISKKGKDRWSLESVQFHGPNVVSFQIKTGELRYSFVGAYIPPDDDETCEHIDQALRRFQSSKRLFLLGDLNMRFENPRDEREHEILDVLMNYGLINLAKHFSQRKRWRAGWTWYQKTVDGPRTAVCDYILANDRRIVWNYSLRQPRFDSDHLMLVIRIRTGNVQRHKAYLKARKRFPLPPVKQPLTLADSLLLELKKFVPKPTRDEKRKYRPWVSPETWRLVDERITLRRNGAGTQQALRVLTRKVKSAFKADRQRQADAVGETIEKLLEGGNVKEAYDIAKGWYKKTAARPPTPSRMDLQKVTDERRDLYEHRQSPGEPPPVLIHPFPIQDDVPTADEIAKATRKLKNNRATGPSKMKAEDLKRWLNMATCEESRDPRPWEKLVQLVQHAFRTGELPTESTRGIIVLLPKGNGEFRGIGLLETIWKLIEKIIDLRIKLKMQYHDVLHGFRPNRGTGTAILEVKLFLQLAAMDQVPTYAVFLDLRKAYDAIDRERTIGILQGYGVGSNTIRLLQNFWQQLEFATRQDKFYGEAFRTGRGTTQGGITSSTIFNILTDCVIRKWLADVLPGAEDTVGIGLRVKKFLSCFFADDGIIASRDPVWLQQAIDRLVELFASVGLETNTTKTQVMINFPGDISKPHSDEEYKRARTGEGMDYHGRKRQPIPCPVCDKPVTGYTIKRHMAQQHQLPYIPMPPPEPPSQLYKCKHKAGVKYVIPKCPVPGCPGKDFSTCHGLRQHFNHRHMESRIWITTESAFPLPQCRKCGLQVKDPSGVQHRNSEIRENGTQRQLQRRLNQQVRAAREKVFFINGVPLKRVEIFKYLGRNLTALDDDWHAIFSNVQKARPQWSRFSKVLSRVNAKPKISAKFYKAVMQAVLLYASETWTVTEDKLAAVQCLHKRVARKIARKEPVFRAHS